MNICKLAFILSFSIQIQAQIDPFLGIVQLDQCDFSTPCPYVYIPSTSSNLWQRGESQKSVLTHNGKVMITDSIQPYPNGTNSSFEIRWPSWNQYPLSLIMSFHHSMDTDTLLDGGIIEVSRDYGNTWTNVIEDQTNMLFLSNELYSHSDTLYTGEKGFSGSFNNRYTEIEWIWMFPIKESPTDTMYYRFRMISDSVDHQREGWMISDLTFSFVDLGSGMEELPLFDFSLRPNPTQGWIEINVPFDLESAIIMDLNGSIIQKDFIENEKVLNYSGLSTGIYFIRLNSNDGRVSQTKRLIID